MKSREFIEGPMKRYVALPKAANLFIYVMQLRVVDEYNSHHGWVVDWKSGNGSMKKGFVSNPDFTITLRDWVLDDFSKGRLNLRESFKDGEQIAVGFASEEIQTWIYSNMRHLMEMLRR